jgi:hypothetical protein
MLMHFVEHGLRGSAVGFFAGESRDLDGALGGGLDEISTLESTDSLDLEIWAVEEGKITHV